MNNYDSRKNKTLRTCASLPVSMSSVKLERKISVCSIVLLCIELKKFITLTAVPRRCN